MSAYVFHAPDNYFELISPLPGGTVFHDKPRNGLDFIHLFCDTQAMFKKELSKALKFLETDGMLWISWPKKASKVPTDLDENIIREFGLQSGVVDVKVCAVDEVWSGLKFVYRLKDRKA